MSKKKSGRSRSFKESGVLFGLGFCRFLRGFLSVFNRIEAVCHEDDAVVLYAVLVVPLFGLEVALNGNERTLGELVERGGVLVLAPRFHIDEGGDAVRFVTVLLLTADCECKACNA